MKTKQNWKEIYMKYKIKLVLKFDLTNNNNNNIIFIYNIKKYIQNVDIRKYIEKFDLQANFIFQNFCLLIKADYEHKSKSVLSNSCLLSNYINNVNYIIFIYFSCCA